MKSLLRISANRSTGSSQPSSLANRAALITALVLSLPIIVNGQTIWTDATGDWFTASNWSLGVPNSTTDARINNSGTAQINAAGATAQSVILGFDTPDPGNLTSSGTGTLNVSSDLSVGYGGTGTLSITNGATVSDYSGQIGYTIFSDTGASGTATVDGAGSTWTHSYELYVGYGTGRLNITNGGAVSDAYGYLGYYPEFPGRSSGMTTVDGVGSTWTNSADLHVGHSGTGVLNVTNGGVVTNGTGYLAYDYFSDGTATVDGSGSIWTTGGFFYVGNNGNGTLNVTKGGRVNSNSSFGYVAYGSSSQSTATIDGSGSMWSNSGGLYVGFSGAGTLSITSGATVTNGTFANIGFSPGATGTVIVDGTGSSFGTGGALSIGGNVSGAGGTGLVRIENGGSVTASTTTVWDTGALEIGFRPSLAVTMLTFDGGTLRATADTAFANNTTLAAGGMILDSNGFTLTLSGIFSGAGGVTKNGDGTVMISGANTYTGDTTINAGTLLIRTKGDSATGTGAILVNAGTLGGTGRTTGPVTVGTGGGSGAFLAPGLHGPGVLSIHEALNFNAGATYQVELQSKELRGRWSCRSTSGD